MKDFPFYVRTLSSFERSIIGNVFWAGSCSRDEEERKNFDDDFNHKRYDELGIPREIQQPVNFEI
jgi:hypothetical protein